MKKRPLINALRKHLKQVTDRKIATEDSGYQAQNLMVSCFQVLHSCGMTYSRQHQWVDRNNFKTTFRRIQKSHVKPKGSKALRKLVELAVSALEACNWREDFPADALPNDPTPRPLTDAQKKANARNLELANARRQEISEIRKIG